MPLRREPMPSRRERFGANVSARTFRSERFVANVSARTFRSERFGANVSARTSPRGRHGVERDENFGRLHPSLLLSLLSLRFISLPARVSFHLRACGAR